VSATLILQFWVIAVLLVLTPGADWAYAIAAGVRTRVVAPSILGLLGGYVVVVVLVAVGAGSLISRFPVALTVLTIAGGVYLLYLGISTLVRRIRPLAVDGQPIDSGWARQFVRGAGVSGINPKGLLLLLALLPQFTTPHGWAPPAQMLVLGSLHLLDCAVVYFSVAYLARRILRSRPRATIVITKLSGIAMTAIGVALLIERIVLLSR
jgi:threonine/homoserine/homoserine lactone efflux protein